MDRGKKMIGLLLIIISITSLVAWEKWGKDKFLYDSVLVLKENVEKGTVITETMLTTKKMDIGEDCILTKEKDSIIGQQAVSFIHKGVPLFHEYFRQSNLSADEKTGRYVLALPEDWILSRPKTLSRGDKVFFFHGDKFVTSAFVSAIGEEGVEVIVNKEQTAALSRIASTGEKLVLIYH